MKRNILGFGVDDDDDLSEFAFDVVVCNVVLAPVVGLAVVVVDLELGEGVELLVLPMLDCVRIGGETREIDVEPS